MYLSGQRYSKIHKMISNCKLAEVSQAHRRLLSPSFHLKIIENAVSSIEKHADILCKQLESMVDRDEFDISKWGEKCCLDIIYETAMGIDLKSQIEHHSEYLENLHAVTKSIALRMFKVWLHPEIFFRMSSMGKEFYNALPKIKSNALKVILDRKQTLMDETRSHNEKNGDGTKKRKPFLDFLLENNQFTNEEIEDEVQTFIAAGHDTINITISFCLYALSQNSHIQDELCKQIDEVVSQKKDNLTLHDYESMKFLENVINETLRMYPAAPFIGRKVQETITIPSGYVIPAGASVNFPIMYTQMDSKYFKNPHQFMPKRFENQEITPYAFIPFSAGPRSCIGKKFAYIEMKIILFKFFQKYRALPASTKKVRLEVGVSLYSHEGCPVKITRRKTRLVN